MSAASTGSAPVPGRAAGTIRLWPFIVSGLCSVALFMSAAAALTEGIGAWGVNTSNVWSLAIVSYAFWAGIASVSVTLGALPILFGWPANDPLLAAARSAGVAAIVAAGIFPIIHLGRPWLFYWLAPYPNTMSLWPQFKSSLVWDMASIVTFLVFSLVIWYLGSLPDFARARNRVTGLVRVFYGLISLGFVGSSREWRQWRAAMVALAVIGAILTPIVQMVASMDTAASAVPQWNLTIMPVEFLSLAVFGGASIMAIVMATLEQSEPRQTRLIAALILAGSLACSYCFIMEVVDARLTDQPTVPDFTTYTQIWWIRIIGISVLPLALSLPSIRRSARFVGLLGFLGLIGLYANHTFAVMQPLSLGALPSQWKEYQLTIWGVGMIVGSTGLFAFVILILKSLTADRPPEADAVPVERQEMEQPA